MNKKTIEKIIKILALIALLMIRFGFSNIGIVLANVVFVGIIVSNV